MFSKILIANRGEIAVRIQHTLKAMGISSVAVYSDPDSEAPHVRMADEAFPLAGSTAEETYLDGPKIVAIAQQSGAQAIHPGYGFLSENPAFAQECQNAGILFIGPSPDSMKLLGDKVRAKELAAKSGVPVLENSPVVTPEIVDYEAIEKIGFPFVIKAAAGGGGRGMRIVERREDTGDALTSASREAHAAFGDGRVFLERYLDRPRHIEVQILADQHGAVLHFPERECSMQRRYQKIVEETPAPSLRDETRQKIGEAAATLARSAGYTNAGTAVFLVDLVMISHISMRGQNRPMR